METSSKGTVKKFNKRAYLKQKLKTNFGSQQEGHGRAFIQKKAVVRQYFRQQRRDEERQRKKIQHQQLTEGDDGATRLEVPGKSDTLMKTDGDEDESVFPQEPRKKMNSWKRAKGEYYKKVAEKEQKKQEALARKKEIEEAKRKFKQKRLQRFKMLNQKTKRGQPIMTGRIELMLEKLKEETKT